MYANISHGFSRASKHDNATEFWIINVLHESYSILMQFNKFMLIKNNDVNMKIEDYFTAK